MSSFVPHIPDWFDTRKAAQVVAFFGLRAGGQINILKVTKLVYLADRLSMERREHPITGDNFVSMPFGPVNSFTYSYMKGVAPVRKRLWAEFVGEEQWHRLSVAKGVEDDALDELSAGDVVILDEIWDTFKNVDRFDLAEFTHRFCPEWRDPNGSSVPIDFATIFRKLGKEDPIDLAEEIQAERALSSAIHGG